MNDWFTCGALATIAAAVRRGGGRKKNPRKMEASSDIVVVGLRRFNKGFQLKKKNNAPRVCVSALRWGRSPGHLLKMAFRRPLVASTAASSMAITMAGVRDKAGDARRFNDFVFRFIL